MSMRPVLTAGALAVLSGCLLVAPARAAVSPAAGTTLETTLRRKPRTSTSSPTATSWST